VLCLAEYARLHPYGKALETSHPYPRYAGANLGHPALRLGVDLAGEPIWVSLPAQSFGSRPIQLIADLQGV
jgi:hypothetical protein